MLQNRCNKKKMVQCQADGAEAELMELQKLKKRLEKPRSTSK